MSEAASTHPNPLVEVMRQAWAIVDTDANMQKAVKFGNRIGREGETVSAKPSLASADAPELFIGLAPGHAVAMQFNSSALALAINVEFEIRTKADAINAQLLAATWSLAWAITKKVVHPKDGTLAIGIPNGIEFVREQSGVRVRMTAQFRLSVNRP